MEPCTYKPVMLTSESVTTSRFLQARKRLRRISERLKLGMSSHMLVYSHLQVQDASSGSVESMRSALADPLLTRHESITCQSSGINSTDHFDLPLLSKPPPGPHRHVQNDGDQYRDEEIPEDFWVENDCATLQCMSNVSEQSRCRKYSATVLSWRSDTPSPPLTMWRQSVETVKSFNCIDKVQTKDPNPFVDMLCDLSSIVIDTSEAENSDQANLSKPYPFVQQIKRDIIQDLGLRIVITPPDDSWESSCYTADNNRIGPQYFTCLAVPPFYQFTSRLVKYEEWMALYHPPVGTVSHDQPSAMPRRTSSGPLVFSPSRFKKYLQETKNDRNDCCHVVTALQRYQLKAVAFTASSKACLFPMHYDIPGFLENIEPRFKWIDPAEIFIESFRHTSQSVTIYTSHRPCSVPHIVIHESPPNDPYVVRNNSPDSQNYRFLAISSPNPSLYDYQIADNCFTNTSSSICDYSAPVTPKDFASTLEQDPDIFFGGDTYQNKYEFVIPQYSKPRDDMTFPSNSKFFIPDDKEEDSLPPLDDWYITIANRCMPPEEAEAVAAATAAMSLVPVA